MYRNLSEDLNKWRVSPRRKPLILKGARQVGKTYLLKNWGESQFPKVHHINFEKNTDASRSFERDFDIGRILRELSFALDTTINPKTDLLLLDEIQACPKAMTALKYFCEDLPELAVTCAGSLLGVRLSPESFPVGKVQFMHLHPMSFPEFLRAVDTKNTLAYLPKASHLADIPAVIHDHLWQLLHLYYVVGGMPEVVSLLSESREEPAWKLRETLEEVRSIQRAIVKSYENDIAKHAGKLNGTHIQALYRNIPSQLSTVHDGTTRRFHFGDVLPGKKGFATWEKPIHWLKNAGLVHQIKIANQSAFPLEHYTKPNMFKLVPHDIGLLGALLDLPPAIIMDKNFGSAKGYFAEVYVAQALIAASPPDKDQALYCLQEGESEIEFLQADERGLIPTEVKSGSRLKARSLGQYISKYKPNLAIRLSANPISFAADRNLLDLPLYLAHWLTLVGKDGA
jgi:predicted AAA+ superfamily ATPase